MSNLNPIIKESFTQYAGAVLQSRALVDVRDCLKPSARQIFYALYTDKYLYNKPYKKTLKAVGSLSRFYIHGDTSAVGVLMRAGQNFAMRYPIADIHGNAGTLLKSGNWAHQRYTETRLSELANSLFNDIDKNTIEEWRENYDDTDKYPAVLPTKGFYNIVNGTMGIGIGAASSIPQFNIREVNEALIKLLWNSDIDFEEIYCKPDFATGGYLLNESEVKESLKNGTGSACKLRSVISFDEKERALVVTEIPYSVYTETICGELEAILNGEDNPGIDRFNDLTGKTPLIKIYLARKANPDKVIRYLYKNTSLQSYYGINMTMLDNGRFPRVFTWKEALQAYLDHEQIIYRRGFEFDLKKINNRIHIIEGLLIALANIDEVVQTIKSSNSTAIASQKLQERFVLDAAQAKAILDMKLSRLAHLEVEKLENEKVSLEKEKKRLEDILNNEELFKKEIEKDLLDIIKKFGDERRTKILSLSENGEEPLEKKQLSLSFTSEGGVFVTETSTLFSQKRNGVGTKFKLDKGEYVIDNIIGENTDTILFFTSHGNFYHMKMGDFEVGEKQYLNSLVTTFPYEKIRAAAILSKNVEKQYILFLTKKGIIKKSKLEDYNLKRNVGATAITLDKDDEIVSILFTNEDKIGILSKNGNFIMIETKDIRAIGRIARGVTAIKLNDNDEVVSARVIPDNTTEILSITEDAYSKRSSIDEFRITGRATKGVKIQKGETLCDFLPINDKEDILVNASTSQIRVKLNDISLLSRGALGTKTIKLAQNSKIIKIEKI